MKLSVLNCDLRMGNKMQRNLPRNAGEENAAAELGESEAPEALLNDVILQNIFKCLSYKDLKSCRDVKNCTWLRNTRKAWWSRAKVVLDDYHWPKGDITDFLNETGMGAHATNYAFRRHLYRISESVWDSFGPSMKYLELKCVTLPSADAFRELIYNRLPNLEELVLRNSSFDSVAVAVETLKWEKPQFGEQKNLKFLTIIDSKLPVSRMEFLSHFPNLKGLETHLGRVDDCKVISVIRDHDPNILQLKHFAIDYRSKYKEHDQSLRLVLLDPNLFFEYIRIRTRACLPETFVDILDLNAGSLRELYISHYDVCRHRSLYLLPRQPLPNLEILSISFFPFSADILQFTPNVKKVELKYNLYCNFHDLLLKCVDPNLRINSCKELTLIDSQKRRNISGSDFAFFLSAFPNVEIFQANRVNNLRFSLICECMTKLKSLNVCESSEVNDTGLLGFHPDCKAGDYIRKPGITNLRDLESFEMNAYPYLGETSIEIRNAEVLLNELEKIPNLKKFKLSGYSYKMKYYKAWKKILERYSGD